MTVAEALDNAARRLRAAGVTEAALDAETLLRHALGWDRASILSRSHEALPAPVEAGFLGLVAARAERRPLQHLTGTQAFWRHDFVVSPDVLIPRPETELLVETGLEAVRSLQAPRVIDVGTGSGCIALSLAAERPDAIVVATDLSAAALAVARQNATRLGLGQRPGLVRADLLDPFRDGAPGVDLVVSNPPYVEEEDWRGLAPEVRDHDPRTALVPEEGVHSLYTRLLAGAARVLREGGTVAVEIGAGQARTVLAQAAAAGFHSARALEDLQRIPRVIVATRGRR